MAEHHLLGFVWALRAGATNRLLMHEARRLVDPVQFTHADLRLPLFDEDIEINQGFPAGVVTLHAQIAAADAVVIATPEYNKSIPGGLKNALDWVSRIRGNPWRDKPVAIVSAADGRAGGDRSQFALRLAMVPFRARVLPGPEVMVAHSREAFGDDGRLKDDRYTKALGELMTLLRAEISRSR